MSETIPLTERFFLYGRCNMVLDRYNDVSPAIYPSSPLLRDAAHI